MWDIAQTVIQKHGERADLVVEAIEKEVEKFDSSLRIMVEYDYEQVKQSFL